MKKFLSILPRWIPALIMMSLIFLFSSQSAGKFPHFPGWDYVIRKTGHLVGYGLLALCFFFALRFRSKYRWTAWILAVLYSFTDEFHQSFVPGRQPSLVDIFVFDNIGALAALWLYSMFGWKSEGKVQGDDF
jgi:VanZ family protein